METVEILAAIQKAADTIATPNWAAIASVVISFLAVIVATGVAIYVAKKQNKITEKQTEIALKQAEIAEQQNKIALFQERYSVYRETMKVQSISLQISSFGVKKRTILLHEIEAIYGVQFPIEESPLDLAVSFISQIKASEYIIRQAVFLFRNIEEEDINGLMDAWIEYAIYLSKGDTSTLVDPNGVAEKAFIEKCNNFYSKYSATIEDQLDLR